MTPTQINTVSGGGGLHHVAIRVRDFDRSVDFYTHTLGFVKKIAWGGPPKRAVMLDAGNGNYLEMFERPDQPPIDEQAVILHFALRTAHVDAVLSRVREAGMTVTMEPKDLDIPADVGKVPVRIAFFKGPDGELIELFQNAMT